MSWYTTQLGLTIPASTLNDERALGLALPASSDLAASRKITGAPMAQF